MDTTTIDILDRALKGDSGALNFLERTASIYVYDGATKGQQISPKTYGCWDFLNQALNEMERYEDWMRRHPQQLQQQRREKMNLEGHMQLLATMSKRAARRSPAADQNLIQICLANAATSKQSFLLSPSTKKQMVDNNTELRERVMGRIAAMVFDFTYHRVPSTPTVAQEPSSCFSNAVSIELLCSIVATNAISSGPDEFTNLVQEWIVPSVDTIPPFSIASIAFHLANEAMGKSAPIGTHHTLQHKLYAPIVSKVLTPLLAEAIRESDTSSSSSSNSPFVNHHRIAAMTIRALNQWCTATETGILHITQVCLAQNVNFTEVIADALYSDSKIVMDALAEYFETLLQRYEVDLNSIHGFHVATSYIQQQQQSSFLKMKQTEKMILQDQSGKDSILSELVAAVSLQRFRFTSCQNRGDMAVCQCLARIVTATAIASETLIRSGRLEASSLDGMMELLLKSVSHPSLHVCGIALEALPSLLLSMQQQQQQQLAIQLLPILQGRAIIPLSLAGTPSSEDLCGVDIHEYENFRENLLSDALNACYTSCRSYYIESCSSAVEEFCATNTTANPNNLQLQFQLEAALFCLCAVSIDASKRALLLGKSPAAQAAAARATASITPTKGQGSTTETIAKEAKIHDDQLSRCVLSLSRSSNFVISNLLTLARACRFCAKYANWISKTPSIGVLDNAAELSLKSFNHTTPILNTITSSSMQGIENMRISPITEATTALRNILYRSPSRFATPQALAALRVGWQAAYENANSTEGKIEINDRVTLCSGICRVLAVLPSDQWSSSLIVLAQPTLECLDSTTKLAGNIDIDSPNISNHGNSAQLQMLLSRIAEEISILSTMTRTFNQTTTSVRSITKNKAAIGEGGHPIFPIFRQVWSCLTHIAQKYGSYETISNALSEFLTVSVSIKDTSNTSGNMILRDLSEMAATIMGTVVSSKNSSSLVHVLEFVSETIETHGHVAEEYVINELCGSINPSLAHANNSKEIIDRLLYLSFETVHTTLAKGSEQGRGQMPFESSSRLETDLDKKTLDYLSGFFTMLTSCINRCPILLINSRFRFAQEDEGIFKRTVDTAVSTLTGKESDVSRSAMIYLKSVIMLEHSLRKKDGAVHHGRLHGKQKDLISFSLTKCVDAIKRGLVLTLIDGVCGIFQQELVDPAASLLFSVLSTTPIEEVGQYCLEALRQEKFLLGENATKTTLDLLGKCARGTSGSTVLMDAMGDIWQMHQCDDTGGTIAKGDTVANFVKKYGSAS